MSTTIDHIGILTDDLDTSVKAYSNLGLVLTEIESFEEFQSQIGFMPVGESLVEFITPLRGQAGLVADWLKASGPGLHHLAFKVDNLEDTLAALKAANVPLVDEKPREGSRGTKAAFIAASGMSGVSVELVEHPK